MKKKVLMRILKKNKKLILLIFLITILITCLALYAGCNLSENPEDEEDVSDGFYISSDTNDKPKPDPIKYKKVNTEINGHQQVYYLLELDLTDKELEVFPVLSHDRVFGFELLKDMDERYGAIATVNAGFCYAYGQPSGLVVQNYKILSGSRGNGPVFILDKARAWFETERIEVVVNLDDKSFYADALNPFPQEKGINVYTPEYGTTNRLSKKNYTLVVENGVVVSKGFVSEHTSIPKEGFLLTDTDESTILKNINIGDKLSISLNKDVKHAYQCSSMLVLDSENVAPDTDSWIGDLRIPAPRTAVGIKDEKTVLFIVADGRIEDYSYGLTGKQLADILIENGVKEAAMLDGGASSQLILNKETVNRPSGGQERLLPAGFVIRQ